MNIIPLNKKSSQGIRNELLDIGKRCHSRLFCPLVTMAASTRSSSINNFSKILEMPIWRIITGSRFLVKGKTQ